MRSNFPNRSLTVTILQAVRLAFVFPAEVGVPFHTVALRWELDGVGDLDELAHVLAHEIRGLMETLRGETA